MAAQDFSTPSSRIFIKGLPPKLTEAEFKKYFSTTSRITDAKLIPNRRIGFVGYETPEDAQKAVKYFNKTFIRMSRIGVELADPAINSWSQKVEPSNKSATENSNKSTLKRKRSDVGGEERDPKLEEFLEVMKPKAKKKKENAHEEAIEGERTNRTAPEENGSDDEYEEIPQKSTLSPQISQSLSEKEKEKVGETGGSAAHIELGESPGDTAPAAAVVSDADWARSRTSRTLGLLDEDEEVVVAHSKETPPSNVDDEAETGVTIKRHVKEAEHSIPTPRSESVADEAQTTSANADHEKVRESMRLYVRNLPYDCKDAELEAEFEPYGNLEEVHVPVDKKTGAKKGFAFIQFSDPDSAEEAFLNKDGQTYHGRLLHIIPAESKRETKLDDFALSKLPLKKQQEIKKRREAGTKTFNWNSLYMNPDAVVSNVANRLGLSKSEVLDPTSSDAAIKQAQAETHVIQEVKAYFSEHGVDLESFKRKQKGDTTILAKNIPYDFSKDELKERFEEHGELKRFLMPPSGTIAIVEFANEAQGKAAFDALNYRRIKSSQLFLEKAPKGLFGASATNTSNAHDISEGISKVSATDLKEADHPAPDTSGRATLYVKNLNFNTTTQQLTDSVKSLDGFLSALVKTKTDPKKPGQLLSMGFGFLEFRNPEQAHSALRVLDGSTLDGHKLQVKSSKNRGTDAAEDRRRAEAQKKAAGKQTKIIIKNLPFETSKKDVRALFGAYGQLRSVRVPQKMDRAARGFAFADFITPKEAQNAMDALKDTHLLGRKLVLDFAAEDPEDAEAEIEKMQQKVGAQVNKVALQKLTSGGRKKFSTQNDEEEA